FAMLISPSVLEYHSQIYEITWRAWNWRGLSKECVLRTLTVSRVSLRLKGETNATNLDFHRGSRKANTKIGPPSKLFQKACDPTMRRIRTSTWNFFLEPEIGTGSLRAFDTGRSRSSAPTPIEHSV